MNFQGHNSAHITCHTLKKLCKKWRQQNIKSKYFNYKWIRSSYSKSVKKWHTFIMLISWLHLTTVPHNIDDAEIKPIQTKMSISKKKKKNWNKLWSWVSYIKLTKVNEMTRELGNWYIYTLMKILQNQSSLTVRLFQKI